MYEMNIFTEEYESPVVAKTCGCTTYKRKVTYALASESHGICIDKKDLLSAQLKACERLIKFAHEEDDRRAVEREIRELRMTLDLLT
jgi:hypothetical protein